MESKVKAELIVKKTKIPVKCTSEKCKEFGRCPQIKTEVHSLNNGKVHVLFVGQGGTQEDENDCLPFKNRAGKELRKDLKAIRKEIGKKFGYAFSNTNRCSPFRHKPTEHHIKHCLKYLHRDIELLQPKVIVPLGKHPISIICPDLEDSSVLKICGKTYKTNISGEEYTVVPSINPAFVLKKSELSEEVRTKLVHSIKKALIQSKLGGNKTAIKIKQSLNTTETSAGKYSKLGTYILLDTFEKAKEYIQFLLDYKGKYVTLDTETKSLGKKFGNALMTMQFATDTETGYILPWKTKNDRPFTKDQYKILRKMLRKLFSGKMDFGYWVIHHSKFDVGILYAQLKCLLSSAKIFDTEAAMFLLDENRLARADLQHPFALQTLSQELLAFYHYDTDIKENRGSLYDMNWRGNKFCTYAGMDAYVLARLFIVMINRAKADSYIDGMRKMIRHFYDPCLRLLSYMEYGGIKVDEDQLKYLMGKESPINTRIAEIEVLFKKNPNVKRANDLLIKSNTKTAINPLIGIKPWTFKLNKPASQQVLFFDVLKLKSVKEGKKGPSVGRVFQDTYQDVPEVSLFDEFKKMSKLRDSYCNSLFDQLQKVDSQDGRVRPNFQFFTRTGRSNCKSPNLQQLPRGKNDAQKAVKNMFACDPNNMLISLDYATNEVRWLALMSRDPGLCEQFTKAKEVRNRLMREPSAKEVVILQKQFKMLNDIHSNSASLMHNVSFDNVDPEMRQAAKSIVFGLMYGKGPTSLCGDIGLDGTKRKNVDYAKSLMRKWYSAFPEAEAWLISKVKQARKFGWVDTPFGRRRHLPDINSSDDGKKNHAENQAKNSPIQATASDTAFLAAALFLFEYVIPKRRLWNIPMIVHDSCTIEIPRVEKVLDELLSVMPHYFTIGVQKYITKNFGFEFLCPLDIDMDISQPAKTEFGNYGYGTSAGWDMSIPGLKTIKDKVEFLSPKKYKRLTGISI